MSFDDYKYFYSFSKSFDDPTPLTGQAVAQDINTSVRGEAIQMDHLFSNMETFLSACGYQLNGSGIGLIPKS